jgi:hypothetical protein
MVVLKDQFSLGMVFQILLCWIDLGWFFLVVAKRFVLIIFFPAATSLIMVIHILGSPTTSTRMFGCSSLDNGVGPLANVG